VLTTVASSSSPASAKAAKADNTTFHFTTPLHRLLNTDKAAHATAAAACLCSTKL
jgi:hypothetical protein